MPVAVDVNPHSLTPPVSPKGEGRVRLVSTPRSPASSLAQVTTVVHYNAKDADDWTPTTATSSQLPDDPDVWLADRHTSSDSDGIGSISDDCPDRALLASVYDTPLYDAEGVAIPFGSLFDPVYSLHQRQLIIFVRHFYCGACQAYLQAISRSITRDDYFTINTPTSIFVIGCGQPNLIPHYKKFTGCPFPMYAEPTRRLFRKLGMMVTLNIGRGRPEYMKDISVPNWISGQFKTVGRSLKDPDGIRKRDVFRGGNMMQIGGEFLFDDGDVIWCHRMRNYRDHTEVTDLRRLLELDP